MLRRSIRASFTMISLCAVATGLAACGGSGGGTGGNGGGGTTTTDTTSTTTTTDTTSSTTTDTTSTSSSTTPPPKGCVDLCTVLNECPGFQPGDCNTDCPPVETFNTTSGCDDEYVAEVECLLGAADPCAAAQGTECDPEVGAYIACRDNYCASNPATPGCN
jgi:hypothetical protein